MEQTHRLEEESTYANVVPVSQPGTPPKEILKFQYHIQDLRSQIDRIKERWDRSSEKTSGSKVRAIRKAVFVEEIFPLFEMIKQILDQTLQMQIEARKLYDEKFSMLDHCVDSFYTNISRLVKHPAIASRCQTFLQFTQLKEQAMTQRAEMQIMVHALEKDILRCISELDFSKTQDEPDNMGASNTEYLKINKFLDAYRMIRRRDPENPLIPAISIEMARSIYYDFFGHTFKKDSANNDPTGFLKEYYDWNHEILELQQEVLRLERWALYLFDLYCSENSK